MFSFIIVQAVKEGRAKTATHVVFVVNEDIDDDLLVARQNLKVNTGHNILLITLICPISVGCHLELCVFCNFNSDYHSVQSKMFLFLDANTRLIILISACCYSKLHNTIASSAIIGVQLL